MDGMATCMRKLSFSRSFSVQARHIISVSPASHLCQKPTCFLQRRTGDTKGMDLSVVFRNVNKSIAVHHIPTFLVCCILASSPLQNKSLCVLCASLPHQFPEASCADMFPALPSKVGQNSRSGTKLKTQLLGGRNFLCMLGFHCRERERERERETPAAFLDLKQLSSLVQTRTELVQSPTDRTTVAQNTKFGNNVRRVSHTWKFCHTACK